MKPTDARPGLLLTVLAALAVVAAVLGGAGCAAPVDADAAPAAAPAHEGAASRASQALDSWVEFPPTVDIPVGASREQVCANEQGDVAAAHAAYEALLRQMGGGEPSRPSTDLRYWVYEYGVASCEMCNLDGMTVDLDTATSYVKEIHIAGGTAAGTRFVSKTGGRVKLSAVFARGATFDGVATIDAQDSDLRCSTLNGPAGAPITMTEAFRLDLAGAVATSELHFQTPDPWRSGAVYTDADLRLTGASLHPIFLEPLTRARFDGMRDATVTFDGMTARDVSFERSTGLTVALKDAALGGAVRTAGATGSFVVAGGKGTFDGADLSDAGDGFGVALATFPNLRLTGGTKWPVGEGHLVADTDLPKLDLSGVHLAIRTGEVWPPAGPTPLRLDGLRLSHGALPDGADLTNATLDGAHLERVVFSNVTLSKNGRHASFKSAHAAQADFGQQVLDGVDFTGADLRGALFSSATGSAKFDQARLGALGPHVDDNDTDIAKITSFEGASLGTSTFKDAYLEYASFDFASVADAHFEGAHLDWASFTDASFQRAGIPNTTLASAASVHAARFEGADLRGVDLGGLDFGPLQGHGASFAKAFLCGAKLTRTRLHDADLHGVYFDVAGDVLFPDGTKGPCAPGDRTGADTSSIDGRIGTRCPNGGHVPAAPGGQCSDAQWKVTGIPADQCTAEEKAHPLDDGGACTKDCQCQSLYCSPAGTCADAP